MSISSELAPVQGCVLLSNQLHLEIANEQFWKAGIASCQTQQADCVITYDDPELLHRCTDAECQWHQGVELTCQVGRSSYVVALTPPK